MTIVVRVFGQDVKNDEQQKLTLIAFDRNKHVITLVGGNTGLWEQAMATAGQNPVIKDDAIPSDPGDHIRYHGELEVLWREFAGRAISRTDESMTHRHFYPWLDEEPDGRVITTLWSLKAFPQRFYRELLKELWPDKFA